MYVIGIDTGGTYTDAVVLDEENRKVIKKVKVFTTKENLHICIGNCFRELDFHEYDKVSSVCISTTLATNAIVENTQCPSGTILIGKTPDGELPDSEYKFLDGLLDIKGYIKIPLDDEEIDSCIREFKRDNTEIEAIAVSGYASTRNPEFELRVKKRIQKLLKLPVVCAHELTTMLGFRERTVTVVLNAGLIPVITELVEAVREVFDKYNVDANYMVVDGTGCLLNSEKVLDQPIRTILSGPASSMMGAQYLTGVENGLIVDIGGTTSDIALIKDGKIELNEEGAEVGPWMTRTKAARIHTFGLGGDTRIYQAETDNMILATNRVWPISYIATQYEYLQREMRNYTDRTCYEDMECVMAYRLARPEKIREEERRILDLLKDGPHCLGWIRDRLGMSWNAFGPHLKRMLQNNRVIGCGFTPTDLMHVRGKYTPFSVETAEFVLDRFASHAGVSREEMTDRITRMILKRLFNYCDAVMGDQKDLPIICIGAPAKCWMEVAREYTDRELVVPEYAEVANAIGAAIGYISPAIEVLIRYDQNHDEYIVFLPGRRSCVPSLEEAKAFALKTARELVATEMKENLCEDYQIEEEMEDCFCEDTFGEQQFVETQICVKGIGRPSLYGSVKEEKEEGSDDGI